VLVLVMVALAGTRDARAEGGAGAATDDPNDLDAGYVAAIAGTCEELVVGSRAVPTCGDTLMNVDFGNGRVAFVFAGRVGDQAVLTIFSGGRSTQPDARTYELRIDRMTIATRGRAGGPDPVAVPAEGTCSMRGDPSREPARFECRVRSAGRKTLARFRSRAPGTAATSGPGRRSMPTPAGTS
jgi:hypothetical protein